MAKYSEEFLKKLVTEYSNGNLGYTRLVRKYNMPSETPLKNWVRAYKTQGIEGLKRKIEDYIYWFNNERSKEKLTGLSPVEYRTQSSQSAA
jgi:transposase InsO family protein